MIKKRNGKIKHKNFNKLKRNLNMNKIINKPKPNLNIRRHELSYDLILENYSVYKHEINNSILKFPDASLKLDVGVNWIPWFTYKRLHKMLKRMICEQHLRFVDLYLFSSMFENYKRQAYLNIDDSFTLISIVLGYIPNDQSQYYYFHFYDVSKFNLDKLKKDKIMNRLNILFGDRIKCLKKIPF